MVRCVWAVVVAAGLGAMAGCGGSSPGTPAPPTGKDALEEIGRMLKLLADDGRKPPAKAADLQPLDPLIPVGGPALRSGDVVYQWGAGYAAGRQDVAAYEKNVPAEGGYVLLTDGTVKKMSASEFTSAPKAGKK